MRPAPLADTAILTLAAQRPPPVAFVRACLDRLRSRSYRRVVTNALAPGDMLPFVDCEFELRERLHVLAHDLSASPERLHRVGRARRADRPAVLALDVLAFDDFWRLDDLGLLDALDATPASRFRVGRDDGRVVAYAITGRSGRQGYVQRLAVHPDWQGVGWGRTMVGDALAWLRARGVRHAVVNTQEHNHAAFDLYLRCGFQPLPVGLSVLERSL